MAPRASAPRATATATTVASAPSPRLAWVVERHLRPMYESVAALIAKMHRAGHWKTISTESVYHVMNGAATSIFVMAPAVVLTTGTNPLSEKHSSAHADAVVELFFPHTRAKTARKASGARRGQSRRTVPTGSSRERRRSS